MDRGCWIAGGLTLGALVAVAGCSDSGSSGPEQCDPAVCLSGVFLDTAVEGLDYESGTPLVFVDGVPAGAHRTTGVTDAEGTFLWDPRVFRDPERVNVPTITFRVGSVELGSAPAADLLTPLDLVEGAKDEQNAIVTQIVRFLLTVDEDGRRDAIEISDTARDFFREKPVDFERRSELDQLLTEVAALLPSVKECADGLDNDNDDLIDTDDPNCTDEEDELEAPTARPIQTRVVIDSVARSHLATTLIGINAGCWEGTWEATGLEEEASPNCGSVGAGAQGRWSLDVDDVLNRSTTGHFANVDGTFCVADPPTDTCPRAAPLAADQNVTGKMETGGDTILNNQTSLAIEGVSTRQGEILGFYSGGGLGMGCFIGEHVPCD
jgi:hypothetical protein